jgi:hypothetical protein
LDPADGLRKTATALPPLAAPFTNESANQGFAEFPGSADLNRTQTRAILAAMVTPGRSAISAA